VFSFRPRNILGIAGTLIVPVALNGNGTHEKSLRHVRLTSQGKKEGVVDYPGYGVAYAEIVAIPISVVNCDGSDELLFGKLSNLNRNREND